MACQEVNFALCYTSGCLDFSCGLMSKVSCNIVHSKVTPTYWIHARSRAVQAMFRDNRQGEASIRACSGDILLRCSS